MPGKDIGSFKVAELAEVRRREGWQGVQYQIRQDLNGWRKKTLNIGVTGTSQSGKSSFINTIRGLTAQDKLSAKTATSEAIEEPVPYYHPYNDSIILWELPSIDKNDPSRNLNSGNYDILLILSSRDFSEELLSLGSTLDPLPVIFVRTKVDGDIQGFRKSNKSHQNVSSFLGDLKKAFDQKAASLGIQANHFLVINQETFQLDFPTLVMHVIDRVPKDKRESALYSFGALRNSKELVESIQESLLKRVSEMALLSIPDSGISSEATILIGDLDNVLDLIGFYFDLFGIDSDSIVGFDMKDIRQRLLLVAATGDVSNDDDDLQSEILENDSETVKLSFKAISRVLIDVLEAIKLISLSNLKKATAKN